MNPEAPEFQFGSFDKLTIIETDKNQDKELAQNKFDKSSEIEYDQFTLTEKDTNSQVENEQFSPTECDKNHDTAYDQYLENSEIVYDQFSDNPEIAYDQFSQNPEIVYDQFSQNPEILYEQFPPNSEEVYDQFSPIECDKNSEIEYDQNPEIIYDQYLQNPDIVYDQFPQNPEIVYDQFSQNTDVVFDQFSPHECDKNPETGFEEFPQNSETMLMQQQNPDIVFDQIPQIEFDSISSVVYSEITCDDVPGFGYENSEYSYDEIYTSRYYKEGPEIILDQEEYKLHNSLITLADKIEAQQKKCNSTDEFFGETLQVDRQQLRELAEYCLFNQPVPVRYKVEEILWRRGYYDVIYFVKRKKKFIHRTEINDFLFNIFLNGISQYTHLVKRIETEYPAYFHGLADFCDIDDEDDDSTEKILLLWLRYAFRRFLMSLGDLHRYNIEISKSENTIPAIKYYVQAMIINPLEGVAHNHIATLYKSCTEYLPAAFHCILSLSYEIPFVEAESNLVHVFNKNHEWLLENDDLYADQPEILSLEDILISRFLLLIDIWYFNKEVDDILSLCHQILIDMDKFLNKHYQIVFNDMKTNEEETYNHLGPIFFKMLGIQIAIMDKLRDENKENFSTLRSFALAFLARLIEHLTKFLKSSILLILRNEIYLKLYLSSSSSSPSEHESKCNEKIEGSLHSSQFISSDDNVPINSEDSTPSYIEDVKTTTSSSSSPPIRCIRRRKPRMMETEDVMSSSESDSSTSEGSMKLRFSSSSSDENEKMDEEGKKKGLIRKRASREKYNFKEEKLSSPDSSSYEKKSRSKRKLPHSPITSKDIIYEENSSDSDKESRQDTYQKEEKPSDLEGEKCNTEKSPYPKEKNQYIEEKISPRFSEEESRYSESSRSSSEESLSKPTPEQLRLKLSPVMERIPKKVKISSLKPRVEVPRLKLSQNNDSSEIEKSPLSEETSPPNNSTDYMSDSSSQSLQPLEHFPRFSTLKIQDIVSILEKETLFEAIHIGFQWLYCDSHLLQDCSRHTPEFFTKLIEFLNLLHLDIDSLENDPNLYNYIKTYNLLSVYESVPLTSDTLLVGLPILHEAFADLFWNRTVCYELNKIEECFLRILKIHKLGNILLSLHQHNFDMTRNADNEIYETLESPYQDEIEDYNNTTLLELPQESAFSLYEISPETSNNDLLDNQSCVSYEPYLESPQRRPMFRIDSPPFYLEDDREKYVCSEGALDLYKTKEDTSDIDEFYINIFIVETPHRLLSPLGFSYIYLVEDVYTNRKSGQMIQYDSLIVEKDPFEEETDLKVRNKREEFKLLLMAGGVIDPYNFKRHWNIQSPPQSYEEFPSSESSVSLNLGFDEKHKYEDYQLDIIKPKKIDNDDDDYYYNDNNSNLSKDDYYYIYDDDHESIVSRGEEPCYIYEDESPGLFIDNDLNDHLISLDLSPEERITLKYSLSPNQMSYDDMNITTKPAEYIEFFSLRLVKSENNIDSEEIEIVEEEINSPPQSPYCQGDNTQEYKQPQEIAREKLLHNLGQLYLKHQVENLETQLECNENPSITPYVTIDCSVLTDHSKTVKQLITLQKCIIIVPDIVIRDLDAHKRDLSAAREAIRFLEYLLESGNKFIRVQRPYESQNITSFIGHPKKKDKQSRTFVKILECCKYFICDSTHEEGSNLTLLMGNTSPNEAIPLVDSEGMEIIYGRSSLSDFFGIRYLHIDEFLKTLT